MRMHDNECVVMPHHGRGIDVGATRCVAPTRRRRASTQIGPYVRLSCVVMPDHMHGVIDDDVGGRAPTQNMRLHDDECVVMPHHVRDIIDTEGRRGASPRHGVAVPRFKLCGCTIMNAWLNQDLLKETTW
ncbi:MAG: hypothetical protein KatS3mg055_1661 [Chloroflexus sp.]|nr:MAG: hypothetical protein KatS3mg055_1661 [Chloroflexus sp.]